ncbi:MAG TPA: DUF3800 domain-containing protein [Candidatus Angelobacter sp.]
MPTEQAQLERIQDRREPASALRTFVYLAYLDDSGTTRPKGKTFQVLSAVLIEDSIYQMLEVEVADCIEKLLPEDRLDSFEEFHATELFNGCNQFEGIDQEKRFAAITRLLELIPFHGLPVVYCAIDDRKLRVSNYGSANPLDICFRICAKGIEEWTAKSAAKETVLLIADQGDKADMASFKKSFRELRKHLRPPEWDVGLFQLHDDIYFGDSRDSIGIQLADLCSYFIGKHLENNVAAEGFYNIIKDQIVYSKIEPE